MIMPNEEPSCEECYYEDEQTGSCTNAEEECLDGSQFVQKIGPAEVFKCFYLVVGKLMVGQIKAGDQNPCIAIKSSSIAKVSDEFELMINYNPKEDSFEFRIPYKELGVSPQKKKRKRGIIKPRRKLIVP